MLLTENRLVEPKRHLLWGNFLTTDVMLSTIVAST